MQQIMRAVAMFFVLGLLNSDKMQLTESLEDHNIEIANSALSSAIAYQEQRPKKKWFLIFFT